MASSLITFLSSEQLVSIANKLPSIDDRQKYCHLINMTADIQAKLNQIRLDRMNANSFKSTPNDTLDYHTSTDHGPTSSTPQMTHQSLTSDIKNIFTNEGSDNGTAHTAATVTSQHSPTSSISFLPSPKLEPHPLERRDSAVDMSLQQNQQSQPYPTPTTSSSSACLVEDYSSKALPAFPPTSKNRDSSKYDSIFDTTSYYYEDQPISVDLDQHPLPITILKKPKVTFADQPMSPAPSPTTTTNINTIPTDTHDDNNTSFLLMTPPVSPRYTENVPQPSRVSTYSKHPLPLPPLLHCQKKTNGFIGLLTRTYQLNEIISSRVQISTLGLVNAIDSSTGQGKAILKVTMTSSQVKPLNDQDNDDTLDMDMLQRFGFTFYASNKRSPNVRRPSRVDPSCVQIDDALMLDALDYWVQHQRDHLPVLTRATHVLRESVKIYVVYDKALIATL